MIAHPLGLALFWSAVTVSEAAAQAPAFAPAKLYATMFVEGTTIALRGTRGDVEGNEDNERFKLVTRPTSVKCRVTNVRSGPGVVLADLACNKEMKDLGATYGATAKGLFRMYEELEGEQVAATVAAVEDGLLVMPAVPKLGKVTLHDEGGVLVLTTKNGAGFCYRTTSAIGDTYQNRYCFAGGRLTAYEADDGSAFPVVISLKR